jgi:hypothetical protein
MPAFQRLATISEAEEANMTTNSLNRYSMPVTRSRSYISELNNDSSIDSNNTTGFLFGDEDSGNGEKSYQAANQNDVFPHLRNSAYGNMVSPLVPIFPVPSSVSSRCRSLEIAPTPRSIQPHPSRNVLWLFLSHTSFSFKFWVHFLTKVNRWSVLPALSGSLYHLQTFDPHPILHLAVDFD